MILKRLQSQERQKIQKNILPTKLLSPCTKNGPKLNNLDKTVKIEKKYHLDKTDKIEKKYHFSETKWSHFQSDNSCECCNLKGFS